MPNFNISEQNIRALAYSTMTYEKGLGYYQSGKVRNFSYEPEQGIIKAQVLGARLYNVQISLLKNGLVYTQKCSCPAFEEHLEGCKHIVAVLKYAQQKVHVIKPAADTSAQAVRNAQQMAEEFISHFENHALEETRTAGEEINLQIGLQLTTDRRPAYLFLKAGFERLYVVKDFEQFLTAIKDKKNLAFGKQFIYEPDRSSFQIQDRPVMNMLLEMHTQYHALNELTTSYYAPSPFTQKALPLSKYYLSRLLDALGDRVFDLSVDFSPDSPTRIHREGMPIEFALAAQEHDLTLTLKEDGESTPPVQLTPDGRYYFYRGAVYLATAGQQRLLPPLLQTFARKSAVHMRISPKQKERFASEILPFIEKAGTLTIAPNVADKFSREDLRVQIYFDRFGEEGLIARVEFHYGGIVINPFAAQNDQVSGPKGDLILIRSAEQEQALLSVFEAAEFKVTQGKVILEGEDRIFEFTTRWLPELQKSAEIFYSDEFKLKIRTSTNFSGRVQLNSTLDMLEISFQYGEINSEELGDIFQALRMKKHYHRLKDGSFLNLEQPEFTSMSQLLDNLNFSIEDLEDQIIHLPKYRAMYIDSFLRQNHFTGVHRNKAFKQLVQSILEPQDGEYELPPHLQTIMRDYQKTGFKWLKTLADYGLGGILADDMGLGKTLQVLAFIQSEKDSRTSFPPALVISPTSLIYNWREEGRKFTPDLNILVIDGTPQERAAQLATFADWDVIVVSYPILRRDIELFAPLDFSYCFLDEAQHIKNSQTLNAKSVQQIKAESCFALTGTPIENSLSELWSLFNCIMPGYLLTHQEFHQKYEIPIAKGEFPQLLTELSRHITPFILRRLKKDVLRELPDKIETILNAPLTEEQKKIYLAYWQQAKQQVARELSSSGFGKSHIKILAALTRLRQICCHPAMFVEDYQGESGKMELFQEILTDALDSGHRILVFSQFTSMLDIIQNYLLQEKIGYFYLNGSTKAAERSQMARAFNEGENEVFLISLKAGGTGLNLTGADMVIHFDPWWNPAVEDQATDRAYRIGQTNTVQVVKLITRGTIEEKVNILQNKKKELIDAIIQPGETLLTKLSEQELRDLFDLTEVYDKGVIADDERINC